MNCDACHQPILQFDGFDIDAVRWTDETGRLRVVCESCQEHAYDAAQERGGRSAEAEQAANTDIYLNLK